MDSKKLDGLPRGIVQPRSDLELKPLWSSSSHLSVSSSYSSILPLVMIVVFCMS